MEFKKTQLDNGLSIVGEVNKAAKSAAVGFFVKTGSRDETDEINGVSHYLEHMVFKGNDRYSAAEVNEAFDRTGAQFNAFTSDEVTVYYAAALPEFISELTDLWSELMRPSLRQEDFDIEKNVIKEEIAMYQDLPSFDVMDRCRSLHFQGYPMANSVLGTVESIDALTSEQMREYFKRRYAPNNMTFVCVGNFDWDKTVEIIKSKCKDWQRSQADRNLVDFKGTAKKDRIEKPNLSREHICLMSHGIAAQDERRHAAGLLTSIIGDDVGSRYFWKIVDKALAETASMSANAMDGTGALYSYIRCSSENYDQVMSIIDEIFKDISENGITAEELQTAKNKTLSSLVIKNEIPMGRLVDVGFSWLYLNEYRTIEKEVEAIRAVTKQDIQDVFEYLNPARYTKFSLGPAG